LEWRFPPSYIFRDIKAAKKPEEKTALKHFQPGKKSPLVCDNDLWRWRARTYLQNARVKREVKYKKNLKNLLKMVPRFRVKI